MLYSLLRLRLVPRHRGFDRFPAGGKKRHATSESCDRYVSMHQTLRILLVAVLCSVTAPRLVHACKCAKAPKVPAAFEAAAAVFEGRVVAIENETDREGDLVAKKIRLRVARAWKGVSTQEILVRTDTSSCGYPFEVNQSYLVYARSIGDAQAQPATPNAPATQYLYADHCSRTAPADSAHKDLRKLGRLGVTPFEPSKQPPAGATKTPSATKAPSPATKTTKAGP